LDEASQWWRRGLLVLRAPRDVFTALRDDSAETAAGRQDVVVALVFFAGIALALGVGGADLRDLDVFDGIVWIFASGVALGFACYWLFGSALAFVVRRLGARGSPRQARHVLAFACAPLLLAIPAWLIFPPLLIALALWSLALLLLGLREVYGWSVGRAAAAAVLSLIWLAALAVGVWSALALLGGLGE
jgi:Yip1 domain